MSVMRKDKLTVLYGNRILQNNFINTYVSYILAGLGKLLHNKREGPVEEGSGRKTLKFNPEEVVQVNPRPAIQNPKRKTWTLSSFAWLAHSQATSKIVTPKP